MNNAETKAPVGFLRVFVSTANGAIPIEGARVEVRTLDDPETENRSELVASYHSDRDGNTERIELTTEPRYLSLTPDGKNPFRSYLITVFKEGYTSVTFAGVTVFEGITGYQEFQLIPLMAR